VYFAAHHAFARPGAPTSPAAWALQEPLIAVLLVLVLLATTVIGLTLLPNGTPPILRAWVLVYPLYLAVGSLVTPSLLRYFMLMFPAALCFTPLGRRRGVAVVLVVAALTLGVLGTGWWVPEFVPPGGDGTYP
jgi:hypothetical protein